MAKIKGPKVHGAYKPQIDALKAFRKVMRPRFKTTRDRAKLIGELGMFWKEWDTEELGPIELALAVWALQRAPGSPAASSRAYRVFAELTLGVSPKRASEFAIALKQCEGMDTKDAKKKLKSLGGVYGAARKRPKR